MFSRGLGKAAASTAAAAAVRTVLGGPSLRSIHSGAGCYAIARGLTEGDIVSGATVGIVGLGKMGAGIAANLVDAGNKVVVYDAATAALKEWAAEDAATVAASPREVASQVDALVSVLPNDKVLRSVVFDGDDGLLAGFNAGALHVSVSTVSPHSSRELAEAHEAQGCSFVGAPIFARPDGVRARQGAFVVGGPAEAVERAAPILRATCPVWNFGDDPGAGNVVKLSGNFLIAATIEALSEALALAETNGVDRVEVMDMLKNTIFDCLIYRGYGQRVSERDHGPGGFALELGLKDVTLVTDTAHASSTPMPFASVLRDRYLSARAQGMADFDWSAIGLLVSSSAGVDVSDATARVQAQVDEDKAKRGD